MLRKDKRRALRRKWSALRDKAKKGMKWLDEDEVLDGVYSRRIGLSTDQLRRKFNAGNYGFESLK